MNFDNPSLKDIEDTIKKYAATGQPINTVKPNHSLIFLDEFSYPTRPLLMNYTLQSLFASVVERLEEMPGIEESLYRPSKGYGIKSKYEYLVSVAISGADALPDNVDDENTLLLNSEGYQYIVTVPASIVEKTQELYEWAGENLTDRWTIVTGPMDSRADFWFMNEEDAMMFKLVWGGQ